MNYIKNFNQFLNEQKYENFLYHGTNQSAGEKILKSNYIIPGKSKMGNLAPRPNMVYLSPNLNYTMHYVIGQNFESYLKTGDYPNNTGNLGYLFLISEKDISNKTILPDEDILGMLTAIALGFKAYDIKDQIPNFKKLDNTTRSELAIAYEEIDDTDYQPEMFDNLEDDLEDGVYPAYAFTGKQITTILDNDILFEITQTYETPISVEGKTPFTHAFTYDKNQYKQLKPDLSNFFELTTKIE